MTSSPSPRSLFTNLLYCKCSVDSMATNNEEEDEADDEQDEEDAPEDDDVDDAEEEEPEEEAEDERLRALLELEYIRLDAILVEKQAEAAERAGVMTAEAAPAVAHAFAAGVAAPSTFMTAAAFVLTASFAVLVKSKHRVFLRFHVAMIYL